MKKSLQIGITGGIGSGKSLICRIFKSLGVPVYDADSHAKELMTTDGILISDIKKEFGELSYHKDGTVNRAHLSEAFKHPEKLKRLNGLVHPRVALDYKRWAETHSNFPYLIKEAALMFESDSYRSLDEIIVVTAPEQLRIQRVLQRDRHRTESQIREIIANQLPEDVKLNRADHVIVNDETSMIIPQVLELHNHFVKGRPQRVVNE